MRQTVGTATRGLAVGCLLGMVFGTLATAQQTEQKPVQPESPAPTVGTGESAAPPAKPVTLTLEQRADIFMARKSYADAVDYYHRALAATGRSDPALWNKLGIAYQQQADYRAARKAYKEAMRYGKDFAEAWNNMGTVYYLENRARKSVKYYRQAIKLHPSNASFHLNLGTSLYRMEKIDQAMEEYRTALGLDPNVLTERSLTGTVVQARGADVRFFYYMAKVFASLGRAEEAVRYLRRAFEDGFHDHKMLDEDQDFKKISQFPAYIELRKNPPKSIKE